FLGFEEGELALCKDCFWKHSLFGGANVNRRHARSGDVAQWKREFTPELAQAFVERFPDALELLGYESDDRWVERLGQKAAAEYPAGQPTDQLGASGLGAVAQTAQGERVARDAEAGHGTEAGRCDLGNGAAARRIGDVHLDRGKADIADGGDQRRI